MKQTLFGFWINVYISYIYLCMLIDKNNMWASIFCFISFSGYPWWKKPHLYVEMKKRISEKAFKMLMATSPPLTQYRITIFILSLYMVHHFVSFRHILPTAVLLGLYSMKLFTNLVNLYYSLRNKLSFTIIIFVITLVWFVLSKCFSNFHVVLFYH